MKSATGGLISYLASNNEYMIAELYTFTLVDGSQLFYTTAKGSLTYGGNTFDGSSVIVQRGQMRSIIGTQVDTLDLTVAATSSQTIGSTPFLQALKLGMFDNAYCLVQRLFMPTFGDTSLGAITLFSGPIAEVDAGRDQATIRVNSDLHILNRQMPRNLYQPSCLNNLFDSQCTLTKSSYATAGAITTANSNVNLTTNVSSSAGNFNLGSIKFTSGACSGLSRTIKSNDALGGFVLINPLPSIPQPTDTFNVYPGCDKQYSTCQSKFNNVIHFRGFPFVPAPESFY